MPNVNPDKSSPPVSGNVEDPHHSHKLVCSQAAIEGQEKSASTLTYSSEDAAVLLTQHELEVKVVEVNDTRKTPDEARGSRDDNQECCHERSKEEAIRERGIREIGISSTAFIGPSCRPQSVIEEELSEFYKELEEIDQQDTVDGKTGNNVDISQPCAPTADPVPTKTSRGTDLKKVYRPYPSHSHGWPRKDYGNARRWRPQSHNNTMWEGSYPYSYQAQWQHAPPRVPQSLERLHFHEPQQFFPPPPPGNPMQPLYFERELNDYDHFENSGWVPWETQFPPGYDVGLAASNQPGLHEWYERNHYDWRQYEVQNHHEEDQYQRSGESFVLILMRGLPGSGKSTLAKDILSTGSTGLILSTDDYYFRENGYFFDPAVLGDAHDWNQKRARESMLEGRSPVIIDNTNVQAWEMKPYVAMALEIGYRVEFVEPNTSWKCDPAQLEKRNKHGVPRETIEKMLGRFEHPMTVDIVMNSCEPPHKSRQPSNPHTQTRFDDM